MIDFPTIDPVLISIGPFAIRWYALSYIAGIFLGSMYLRYLNKKEPQLFSNQAQDDMLIYTVLGIILGGRIGYILFYNAGYYLEHPIEALKLWQGGMSFHGGLAGVAVALYLVCRKYTIPLIAAADLIACVAPIGIALGRIANFINGELYGRVTDAPWGMVFPGGGELPRHPSQIYESLLEGVALCIILSVLAIGFQARKKEGLLVGVFLLWYASARMFVEIFREPDVQIGFIFNYITMGQLLSLPMALVGAAFIMRALLCKRS